MARTLKGSNRALKEMEKAYDQSFGSGRQASLALSSLTPYVDSDGTTNDYLFGPVNEETVKNLANGIKQDGFQGAINVWELGDNKFMIFSGHRRAKAMEVLGEETIPCFVYAYPEEETKRRYIFLRSNILSRGSVRAADKDIYIARQMAYLADIDKRCGFDGSDSELNNLVGAEFNTSRVTVWRYLTLLSAPQELLDLEEQGLLPLAQAAALSMLSREDRSTVLSAITSANEAGTILSREDIEKIIRKIKNINEENAAAIGFDQVSKSTEVSAFVTALLQAKLQGQGTARDQAQETSKEDKPPRRRESAAPAFKLIDAADRFLLNVQKQPLTEGEKAEVLEKLQALIDEVKKM